MRVRLIGAVVLGSLLACGVASWANETITYTYDARGRLISVKHTGDVNNNVVANYELDRMGNRKNVEVKGSTNPPPGP